MGEHESQSGREGAGPQVGANTSVISDAEDMVLRNIYYDAAHPAGYSTLPILAKATHISPAKVKTWLEGEEPYTLHRPARKRFARNAYHVFFPDELWQADLVDMQSKASQNAGYRYILTVIDVFSKQAYARALRTKSGVAITEAFQDILKASGKKPQFLQFDKGKEFLNETFLPFLRREGIHYYHSHNPDVKCGVIERFNRTLKARMWKHFTHTSSYQYVDALPKLIEGYNKAFHSTIKMAPQDVNETNMAVVYRNLKRTWPISQGKQNLLRIGDHVRVQIDKGPFGKSYEENWSQETFKIKRILPRTPVVYRIEDQQGEEVQGTYYTHELQKVKPPEIFKIEKVLRTHKRNGKTSYFVKFRGYPDKFNAWVDNLVNLA